MARNKAEEVAIALLVISIVLAIAFAILTALSATFTDATVSSNWLSGIRSSSALVGTILFVLMAGVALAVVKFATGQHGGRD